MRIPLDALRRPAPAALAAFLLANVLGQAAFYRWRLDAVLGAVLEVEGRGGPLRHATMGFVLYGTATLALATFAGWALLARTRVLGRLATAVAVLLTTAVTCCVYVETTVFKDHGVHFYEFDLAELFTNAWIARDFGIRPQDLAFALAVGAAIVVAEAAFLLWLRRRAAAGGIMGPWSLAGLGIIAASGLLLYAAHGPRVVRDRHEFLESLPLRHVLLAESRHRPHIDVEPRLGDGGYPTPATTTPPTLAERRNVVFWVGDGLRADHVTPELTPRLLAWGERPDVLVPERLYSTGHATEIGFFGLLFGLDAWHYHPFARHHVRPWPLEVLEANGYVTALVAGSRFNKYPTDFLAGAFQEVHYPDDDEDIAGIVERFLAEREADGRPYFLLLFHYTPHYPFDTSRAHNRVDAPYLVESERSPFVSYDDPDFQERVRNSYRNAVRQADEYFAETWARFRDDFEAGRTVLVATSEHGTEFWEHGLFGHGRSTFWNEKVLVPGFLGLPGASAAPSRTPPLASVKDVWPTVMETLAPHPAAPASSWSDGVSLLSTPPETLAARRDVMVSGRYFPWADRPNLVVDGKRKRWIQVTGVGSGGRFLVEETRTTDLMDRPAPAGEGGVPPSLVRQLESRFWRFLEPGAGSSVQDLPLRAGLGSDR